MRHQEAEGGRRKFPNAFTGSQDIENNFTVLKELIEKQSKPSPGTRIGYKRYDEEGGM